MLYNEFVYRIAYIVSRGGLSVSFGSAQDRFRIWWVNTVIPGGTPYGGHPLGSRHPTTSAGIKYGGPGINLTYPLVQHIIVRQNNWKFQTRDVMKISTIIILGLMVLMLMTGCSPPSGAELDTIYGNPYESSDRWRTFGHEPLQDTKQRQLDDGHR